MSKQSIIYIKSSVSKSVSISNLDTFDSYQIKSCSDEDFLAVACKTVDFFVKVFNDITCDSVLVCEEFPDCIFDQFHTQFLSSSILLYHNGAVTVYYLADAIKIEYHNDGDIIVTFPDLNTITFRVVTLNTVKPTFLKFE